MRRAGKSCLPIVGAELCKILRNESVKNRPKVWKQSIKPLFEGLWPLDYKLQTTNANEFLIELICLSESDFKDAFSVVSPFIKKSKNQSVKSVCLLQDLGEDQVKSTPKDVLDLLSCIIGENPTSQQSTITELLCQIKEGDSRIENTKKFQQISKLIANR